MNFNRSFGKAIEALNAGHIVARVGWNGKGMFLFLRPEAVVPVELVKTLPDSVKRFYKAQNITDVLFTGYICMKAADNTIVNGWLASQTDMLSNDWGIIE